MHVYNRLHFTNSEKKFLILLEQHRNSVILRHQKRTLTRK